ncbi:MAG: Na/Pi cotransporter family protein, partial [Desulfobulbus sp.]|nr:Na/Pi cotransporter family protein [Desulfobulbus sp.]
LHNATPQVAEAALAALDNEVRHQLLLTIRSIGHRYGMRAEPGTPAAQGLPVNGRRPPRPPGYDDLERLHAEIFTFSSHIPTQDLEPREAARLDEVLRASRSIMNAARTLSLLQPEAEEIDREKQPLFVRADLTFRKRLGRLWAAVENMAGTAQAEPLEETLPDQLAALEEADQAFIRACSASVARLLVHEEEVTRLLMINRFFNQSCRMLLLALQALALADTGTPPVERPAPASPEAIAP